MIIKLFKSLFFIIFLFVALVSCEEIKDEIENEDDTLYVKFENDAGSEYTITSIRILLMGKAGDVIPIPDGEFSENILAQGQTIAPGAHVFLTLDIPNLDYALYRLTVDNGQGTQIYLFDQTGYEDLYDGTITHWGGDERTVFARVIWDESAQYIYVQAWGDNVGID